MGFAGNRAAKNAPYMKTCPFDKHIVQLTRTMTHSNNLIYLVGSLQHQVGNPMTTQSGT